VSLAGLWRRSVWLRADLGFPREAGDGNRSRTISLGSLWRCPHPPADSAPAGSWRSVRRLL